MNNQDSTQDLVNSSRLSEKSKQDADESGLTLIRDGFRPKMSKYLCLSGESAPNNSFSDKLLAGCFMTGILTMLQEGTRASAAEVKFGLRGPAQFLAGFQKMT